MVLQKPAAEAGLDTAVHRYLLEVLGVRANPRPWPGQRTLPYFLQEAYDLRELRLWDRPILLAIDRQAATRGLAHTRGHVDKIRAIAGRPVVYVTETLASYERRHLIAKKVPFIVPGNQLFLPELGLDLREYFRGRARTADVHLSPATQAVLIATLLRVPWQVEWQPPTAVTELGYTPMTLSRVVKELVAAGLATVRNDGKARWIRMASSPADTWERAKPGLRSPVKRLVWAPASPTALPPGARLAGLTALARVSMLADPLEPTYALSPSQWNAVRQARVATLPMQMPGACEWQLWSYSPALAPNSDTVDPLSLMLSLSDEADERVQKALTELRRTLPW
jgi:hypothetical protein